MTTPTPASVLVDRTNADVLIPEIIRRVSQTNFVGFDVETHDEGRHDGLNRFSGYRPDGSRSKTKKLAFDFRRMTLTGFSVYCDGDDIAFYLNINQADVENRLDWSEVKPILEALPEGGYFVCHNASYELTSLKSIYDFDLPRAICTMQMAVSAFGPDEYDQAAFMNHGQGGIRALIPDLIHKSATGYRDGKLSNDLEEVVQKILGKQSKAAHSYNGYLSDIVYGYGLKQLVKRFFGYEMTTFEQVLGDKNNMGELTGAEVVAYGADDAVWAVRLFHRLLQYMVEKNPAVVDTFFKQELPMVKEFSNITLGGMQVNLEAIQGRRDLEREENAKILREMKAIIREMLPFPDQPHEGLMKRDSWYAKDPEKYRKQLVKWVNSPDVADSYQQCRQTRGALVNAWAAEKGEPEPNGINLTYYAVQRVMLYDLTSTKLIIVHGKTTSDGEARGKLKERFDEEGNVNASKVIDCLNRLASIDQRLKLFISPYLNLTDPETQKLYPTVTSMLATRRMAARDPNPLQLAKRGDSTYVRGFFKGDYDDHVLISCDWSAQELLLIGEYSGDPEFFKAYGQIPHQDLHAGAAAACLSVEVEGLTEEILKSVRDFEHADDFKKEYASTVANMDRLFTDLKGAELPIGKVFKHWRNNVGKVASFGFWFSGAVSSVGEKMGWSPEKMWAATEAYRDKYAVAEAWRLGVIETIKRQGYVELPDHHRRVRFEATDFWKQLFLDKFLLPGDDMVSMAYNAVWNHIAYKIQRRAWNQGVNAMIQGSGAILAKRSILNIREKQKALGWGDREFRFVMPIHDELVYSVHKDLAVEATHLIRDTMINHPDLIKTLKLDASPSIGLTFEPYDKVKAPKGQIELFEAPHFDFLPKSTWDNRMSDDDIRATVDYLFSRQT